MALTSPGVEVTIIDESQYIPSATNSVPYILLVTAQNKVSGAGIGVAAGTLAANANQVREMTSQRDLLATYGNPFFYKTTAGTPINGYELNEYGLLAAYSALGVSNRCYVQRADIDLAELTATLVRPTGEPNNGTYWLDDSSSAAGLFQWNASGTGSFANKIPLAITESADLEPSSTVPLQSIGSIGEYAIVTESTNNPVYFKRGGPTSDQTSSVALGNLYNTWVLLGSDDWKTAWPTIQGTLAPTTLPLGNAITINGFNVSVPGAPNNTVEGLSDAINSAAIPGVYSSFINGQLQIYGDSDASNDSSNVSGVIQIANQTGTPLAALGITVGVYNAPKLLTSYSYNAPRWGSTQTEPAPTGSVWQKMNNVNLGLNLVVKKYDSTLGQFVQQGCPWYPSESDALYQLDSTGGGINIPAGATIALNPGGYDFADSTVQVISQFTIYERFASGATIITGNDTTPGPFISGNTFTISASEPGSTTFTTPVTATLLGTTASDFISAVSAANVAFVSASINSAGAIVITHAAGGSIKLVNTAGVPVTTAGFVTSVRGVRNNFVNGNVSGIILSNWVTTPTFTYTASNTAPDQDPANDRLWYYSTSTVADIMIQDGGEWKGYQNVTNDVRGDNLALTNATGPIFAATPPLTQTDESESALVPGDLWIDTSDLENYPQTYRWTNVNGNDEWVLLDNISL